MSSNKQIKKNYCYLCDSENLEKIEDILVKPDVEVDYAIPKDIYYREIYQCNNCGVYNNFHVLIDEGFYEGFYNNSITHKPLKERFDRIIQIPKGKSDNKKRVKRIIKFLKENFKEIDNKSVLDVGSGTCVFLYEMQKEKLKTTCIDPDEQAIKHAIDNVNVSSAHCGDLFNFQTAKKYDLITFNKVLEHIKKPIINIKKALEYLTDGGVLYIEMPEGDEINRDNLISKRAEFAVEHYTIYNKKSMINIAKQCSINLVEMGVITDPSGKKTIYAFYKK